MLIDIVEVRVAQGYTLWLKFEDGTEGSVNIRELLANFTGVFAKFSNQDYFNKVKVDAEIGTLIWPENVDLCPDVLYAAVKRLPRPDLTSPISA